MSRKENLILIKLEISCLRLSSNPTLLSLRVWRTGKCHNTTYETPDALNCLFVPKIFVCIEIFKFFKLPFWEFDTTLAVISPGCSNGNRKTIYQLITPILPPLVDNFDSNNIGKIIVDQVLNSSSSLLQIGIKNFPNIAPPRTYLTFNKKIAAS